MPGKTAGLLAMLLAFQEPTTWGSSAGPEVRPRIVRRQMVTGKVNVVDLSAHFSTAIRLPEAVSSVVVGDPALFKVEHSEKEPRLVFVKSLTQGPAQTNLLVSTVGGTSVSVLLRTMGEQIRTPGSTGQSSPRLVHFLIELEPDSGFLVQETGYASMFVAETTSVAQAAPTGVEGLQSQSTGGLMNRLLEEGMRSPLPRLDRRPLRAGISQIYEENRDIFVLFSVVNDSKQPIELLPPQVQLAGDGRKGRGSVVQLPVEEYRLSRRRIGPHERADGVVQFEKLAFKQSHESYLLQIAESSAVDRPCLISIQVGSGQALKE